MTYREALRRLVERTPVKFKQESDLYPDLGNFSLLPSVYAGVKRVQESREVDDVILNELAATHYYITASDVRQGLFVIRFYKADAFGAARVDESMFVKEEEVDIYE
jgi:hypothetical protein